MSLSFLFHLRLFSLDILTLDMEPNSVCENTIARMLKGFLYLEVNFLIIRSFNINKSIIGTCSMWAKSFSFQSDLFMLYLQHLSIKFQLVHPAFGFFESSQFALPKTIKVLLLQPIHARQASRLILNNICDTEPVAPVAAVGNFYLGTSWGSNLQSLTLVLNIISDQLITTITKNLHHLVELCLEDKPFEEPLLLHDLTNSGLQSLSLCQNLTRLSLTRSKTYIPATFRRVNDVGILLLVEGCKRLESVRLGGFARVTDAGYAAVLHSCKSLKKFEIVNASFLSDLAFLDLSAATSLVEVRLVSCNLITSETALSLSTCSNMEVLDLSGCKSIADSGVISFSKLSKLNVLDLGGSDITDIGLSALGGGSSPISSLCLRGCKRITDRGIAHLFNGKGIIRNTILTLDMGYLPRISDKAVVVIAKACTEITILCIRNCFGITNASIEALGSLNHLVGRRTIRMLDVSNCCGLSVDSLMFLAPPFFCGLRWLGIGNTSLARKSKRRDMELLGGRVGFRLCIEGCEMGCKNGWYSHKFI